MKLDSLLAFQMFSSMKLHFTQESFNINDYGYCKRRFNASQLEKRKDKKFFGALANELQKEERLKLFFASNFVFNPDVWVGDLVGNDSAIANYQAMKKYKMSTSKTLQDDTKSLIYTSVSGVTTIRTFPEIVRSRDGDLPLFVKKVLSLEIRPETAVFYDRIFNAFDLVDKDIGADHLIWKDVRHRLQKFSSFVTVENTETMRKIRNVLRETLESTY